MIKNIPVNNSHLLKQAFIHRSYLNESSEFSQSNERLEYLGDAVLELAVSEHLYQLFPDKPEGDLTALRASLVKTTTLAKVAGELDLGNQLQMSRGEAQTGGRTNPGLLANTFEAIIGAIYLDSNYETVTKFLSTYLFPRLQDIIKNNLYRDYKSTFQERVQSGGHPTPTYRVISQSGPDHNKTFTMALIVNDQEVSHGNGKSKQLAEQDAAKHGLQKLDAGYDL